MASGDRIYDIFMISLFVFVPEVFLATCLVGIRSACYELSNVRFFEASGESMAWPLLLLASGTMLLGLF